MGFFFMEESALKIQLSDSMLPYPDGVIDRAKYHFWRGIYPVYGNLRDGLLALRILHHEGRQQFLLGTLAPGRKMEDFLKYLESQGCGNHFVEWIDQDEFIALRKLNGFHYQYHLRIFKDGEVRGHYEYTPEYRPIWHFTEHGMEERREEFMRLLGDWIVPGTE